MKSDLNAILPELGDHLTVRLTDPNQPYQAFKDFVIFTCSQILMRKKRLNINHVDDRHDQTQTQEGDDDTYDLSTKEGVLAAVSRI